MEPRRIIWHIISTLKSVKFGIDGGTFPEKVRTSSTVDEVHHSTRIQKNNIDFLVRDDYA